MEKFCQHIEKLLAQHDYVVVPNLGGFVVQIQSAKVLPDRITPPLATIAFNPLMHHADGLLAIEIARSEQISYRQSMEYINKQVESLKLKLNSIGYANFGNIGNFNQDKTGALIFSPFDQADFLPFNFQLSDLHIPTKESRRIENQKNITISLHSSNLFKYAAAAMLIFGLFFSTPKINDVRRANNAGLVSISLSNNQRIISKPRPASVKTEIEAKSTTTKTIVKDSVSSKQNFHVIIASLSTKESAEQLCKELASEEFPNAQVLPPAKTYRVAIQSFSERKEAIKYMEKLRETDSRFETAWVLCN